MASNPAARVHAILVKAHSDNSNNPTLDVWKRIFGIKGKGPPADHEAVQRIGLINAQVQRTRSALRLMNKDPDTWTPILDGVEEALSLRLLTRPWSETRSHLSEAVLGGLRLLAEFLPDEEGEAEIGDSGGVTELTSELESLQGRIQAEETLPNEAKHFLRIQLDFAYRALADYPICGMAAFRDASKQAALYWATQGQAVADHEDNETVREVRGFWERMTKWVVKDVIAAGVVFNLLSGGTSAALEGGKQRRLLPPGPPAQQEQVEDGSRDRERSDSESPEGKMPRPHGPPTVEEEDEGKED